MNQKMLHRPSFLLGFNNILPIMPSVIIFGLILGITGANSDLSLFIVSATSYIIFAGSSQFIVILLIGSNEPIIAIIVAGVFINLRHLLYGAVLNPHIKAKGLKKLIISYLLTDEAFLITTLTQTQEKENIKEGFYKVDDILIGSGFTLWSSWNIATIIGYLSYSFIKNFLTFSSEFIVAATFLGYFVLHWNRSPSKERLFIVLMSFLSLIFALLVQSSTLIIMILILGIIIAMFQRYMEAPSMNKLEEN